MNKIVCHYNDESLDFIRENEDLILLFESFDSFKNFIEDRRNVTKRYHYVVKMVYSSLSQFEILESLQYVNADFIFCNLGDKVKVLSLIENLRSLHIRIYLTPEEQSNYASLKFLASLGVGCGLWIDKDSVVSDDEFADLASYNFMSPVNHAHIEPFAYIGSHIQDEHNVSLDDLYFRGVGTYKLDKSQNLINVLTNKILCVYSECTDELQQKDSTDTNLLNYYNHFMDLDRCAKCKAFRICSGSLSNNLINCEETMSEILDYVALSRNVQRNNM